MGVSDRLHVVHDDVDAEPLLDRDEQPLYYTHFLVKIIFSLVIDLLLSFDICRQHL